MKIFSEKKMAPALVLYCLTHPLAPTQTAPRQPLGLKTCEYPAGNKGEPSPVLTCFWKDCAACGEGRFREAGGGRSSAEKRKISPECIWAESAADPQMRGEFKMVSLRVCLFLIRRYSLPTKCLLSVRRLETRS